ncbi:glycosyltransferase family 4 protein [Pseudomonas sp. GG8]
MQILVLSQYFWPENFIINDFVKVLSAQGNEVVVATGKPNYPDGKIFPGYSKDGVMRDTWFDDIEVVRVPLYPRGKGGAVNLLKNYFSFVCYGLWYFPKLLKGKQFDVIFVFAPSPILQVIPALLLKKIKRAHLAVWVQDLWPESLAATGFIKNKMALKVVGWGVRAIYSYCDTLLVQSKSFVEPVAKFAARNKILYYPNSLLSSSLDEKNGMLPAELQEKLSSGFNLVFAGNIGTAQAVETLIEACRRLKGDSDFKLFMVGSGSRLDWVKACKESDKLDNLILPGRFPAAMMPSIFEKASALLVSLKDDEIFSYTIPSKIQSYLAAGRPVIASLRGEGAQVVKDAGAGFSCAPENAEELVLCIKKMMDLDPVERQHLGVSGKQFYEKNFEMRQQVHNLVNILQEKLKKSRENE